MHWMQLIESWTNLVSHDKRNGIQRLRFNLLLPECTGVIMGIQIPLLIIGRSLCLGHDWSVLGPYGNTLKGLMNIGDLFGTIGVTGEERKTYQKSSVLVRRTFGVSWKEFRIIGR